MNKNENTEVRTCGIDFEAIAQEVRKKEKQNFRYLIVAIIILALMLTGCLYIVTATLASDFNPIEVTTTTPVLSLSTDTSEGFIVYLSYDSTEYILANNTEDDGLQLLRYPVDKTTLFTLEEIESPYATVNTYDSKFNASRINSVELYLPEYVIENYQ